MRGYMHIHICIACCRRLIHIYIACCRHLMRGIYIHTFIYIYTYCLLQAPTSGSRGISPKKTAENSRVAQRSGMARYSKEYLYWYKSTNTDAEGAAFFFS